MTRRFLNTQFKIISAEETLGLALEKNDLLSQLGGDKNRAIQRMKKSLKVGQLTGTDLIEISYRDEDSTIAYEACCAVIESYKERRRNLQLEVRRNWLAEIKRELEMTKKHTEELRSKLGELAERAVIQNQQGYRDEEDQASMPQTLKKARSEYQIALKKLNQIQIKYDIERTKLQLPVEDVIIHEAPKIASQPITMDRQTVSAIASVVTIPFGLIGGIVLMYLAELVCRAKDGEA